MLYRLDTNHNFMPHKGFHTINFESNLTVPRSRAIFHEHLLDSVI